MSLAKCRQQLKSFSSPEINAGHQTSSCTKLPLTDSTLHSAGHRDCYVNLCILNISVFIFYGYFLVCIIY